jgi:hypothetical protein
MSLEQKHTKRMRKLVHLDIGQMGEETSLRYGLVGHLPYTRID